MSIRQELARTALLLTLSWLVLLVLAACPGPAAREPLPDWSVGGSLDAGGGVDAAQPPDDQPFELSAATDVNYDTRLRQSGTQNTACVVFPDGTTAGFYTLDCRLDINELDLYGNGLDFDFSVPEGACEYVVYWHSMYEAFEVGQGPTEVSWDVDMTGNISNSVNAINGVPWCEFDHSKQIAQAPNCCTGGYTVSITHTDTGEVEVLPPQFWGGNPADCYNGAAYWDPEVSKNAAGWPMGTIVFLHQQSWSKRFHWAALSTDYYSNVVLANYYDPADHQPGGAPAGFLGDYSEQYSVFRCYDHAEELLAELRLVVREWNEEAQFDADADPDTTGTEPYSGTPINDRRDWADATPGSTTFVGLAQ